MRLLSKPFSSPFLVALSVKKGSESMDLEAKTHYCDRGTESVFHVLGFLRSCFVVTVCVRTLECKYIHKKASDGSEREARGAGGDVCEWTTRRKWIESNRYILCQDFFVAFRLQYRLIFSVLPTYTKWQLFRVIPHKQHIFFYLLEALFFDTPDRLRLNSTNLPYVIKVERSLVCKPEYQFTNLDVYLWIVVTVSLLKRQDSVTAISRSAVRRC